MNPTLLRCARLLAGILSAAAALILLPGCQGHKIVARVRTEAISENELEERALRSHITQGVTGLDVGGFTLVLMIKDELTHQLAKIKHADISNEEVQTFAAFLKRMDPRYINAMNAGNLSDEEFERQQRETLETVGIGTEGAKADDQAIQAKYNELTKAAPGQHPQMAFPELWTLRRLPFGDEPTAQRAIEMLNARTAFPIVAQQLLGAPAMLAQRLTADNVFIARQIQQENPAGAPGKPLRRGARPAPEPGAPIGGSACGGSALCGRASAGRCLKAGAHSDGGDNNRAGNRRGRAQS